VIRINLLPTKRKKVAAMSAKPVVQAGGGALTVMLMIIGWAALGGAGWWMIELETVATDEVRRAANAATEEAKKLSADLNEDELKRREDELKQVELAITKLKKRKRTPVYVMYELAMILTDAKDGGGPQIDREKYAKNKKEDPQNEINARWDPTGLWLSTVTEQEGVVTIEGAARDAADLSEFVRRLRASRWFGDITHPDFERSGDIERDEARHLTWKLDVAVRRWN